METGEIDRQRVLDDEHLRLLALFHYISGGLGILFSSMFIVHAAVMGFLAANADKFQGLSGNKAAAIPAGFFIVLAVVFGLLVFLGIAYGVAQIYSGRLISQGKYRMFSLVVAVPNLLFIPYGTLLSVMTLIVLNRESVRQRYLSQQDAG